MTKAQGYTTIGAVLLAGAVFRGSLSSGPSQGAEKPRETTLASAEKPATGEGPWLASCRYWAAVQPAAPTAAKTTPHLNIKLTQTDTTFDAAVTGTLDGKKTVCEQSGDGWGIPDKASKPDLEIHAIIATVPDPIHSHLALEFDRSIDSFMQAAADNHYLGSSYWLPWRSPPSPVTLAQPAVADQTMERKRQEQPGLIILKYNPNLNEGGAETTSFYHVVYLFLVGESPALGMDGTQLRNALEYESHLREAYGAALSMERPGNAGDLPYTLAFIGPRSSGSATSLRQALLSADFEKPPNKIIGAGVTSTEISQSELNSLSKPQITYISFGEDIKFEENQLVSAFGKDVEHTAILVEDNTTFGAANLQADLNNKTPPELVSRRLYIRFPREISLLRNAQVEQGLFSSSSQAPSPYLNLSLKDPSADDTIPKFSATQTPLSQEAQLMAIERQLQKAHIQHILITASNVLDEIFLARELRRACPNADIVFYNGGDLLFERDVDNVPYIGSITVTPYSLVTFDRPSVTSRRFFSDSQAASAYNAASYIFWWGSDEWRNNHLPRLAGSFQPSPNSLQFPLMVMAVGGDGYYPLGILNPCAGDSAGILPEIRLPDIKNHILATCTSSGTHGSPARITIPAPEVPSVMPSMFWYLLCASLIALSLTHAGVLHSASYWSPFTRDLAVRQNDQPRRRAVYIHIGASMLVSMALVLTVPWFTFWRGSKWYWYLPAFIAACLTLISAAAAAAVTLSKTAGYRSPQGGAAPGDQTRLYPWFNRMAAAVIVIVLVSMLWICLHDPASWGTSYVGLFFSYRCLHPVSGVSPVLPLLLLLFAWYLWALVQTARLRFSSMNRPRLPGPVASASSYPLFVTDQGLDNCSPPLSCCLFENIDCLLITRALARRFTGWSDRTLNWSLALLYLVAFLLCAVGLRIQSMERFLHPGYLLTAYEWLIAILLYPLVMIALAGWLRVLLIWSAIKDGLLEQLERSPFRLAFSRLSEVDWVTMLGQSGLNVRWRDMARSTESLRQLMNNDEIKAAAGSGWESLKVAYDDLTAQIKYLLLAIVGGAVPISVPLECTGDDQDLPHEQTRRELCFINAIERRYAIFCERLLEYVLIPYWNERRIGFVTELMPDSPGARHVTDAPQEPLHIRLAEEFLAIRYVALIRTVLVNIRHLMIFVSAAFVLAIVAWNSYPFQPHQIIDWCFTILMLCLSVGFILVFAQMHRNPILSRITATTPNELGVDFYIRLVTFGAVPVLTWLAYQFPQIGGSIFRLVQPSLQVAK
ncbi:MAG TPA: hypothetical protein VIX42_00185 [Edaphobacter sp.]